MTGVFLALLFESCTKPKHAEVYAVGLFLLEAEPPAGEAAAGQKVRDLVQSAELSVAGVPNARNDHARSGDLRVDGAHMDI
eukprot:CAMPEP_0181328172 /NCGR_PEP_ID=MMETSP1101-20121128/22544_1 /TAXON_ID=46948 /ORGANISM="Rhodomonas abbreviata, Strain Caron Lab Isolate" /LENGTH=80 /DNA_ID=CAMNT_0023436983 /DNA_START=54 /DNA_END=292 /DNA_ORIENTATION=-